MMMRVLEWLKKIILPDTRAPRPPREGAAEGGMSASPVAQGDTTYSSHVRDSAPVRAPDAHAVSSEQEADVDQKHGRASRPSSPRSEKKVASAGYQKRRLVDDQGVVIQRILSGASDVTLVTGAAGTGKSHVVKRLQQETGCLTVAPTGIAALAVESDTIHRAFGLPIGVLVAPNTPKPSPEALHRLRSVTRLVIDEVSMVRADILDAVDSVMRIATGHDAPFGSVPVVLVGDPYQLPPVATPAQQRALREAGYRTRFFYSARVLKNRPPEVLELRVQHRQSADAEFMKILDRVRIGAHRPEDLARLNSRRLQTRSVPSTVPILCARNAEANAINSRRLADIQSELHTYDAVDRWPVGEKPAESRLILKEGARVILIRNDKEQRWVNGSRGTVRELKPESVVVQIDGGKTVEVERTRWELRKPKAAQVVPVANPKIGARVVFAGSDEVGRWTEGDSGRVTVLRRDSFYVRVDNGVTVELSRASASSLLVEVSSVNDASSPHYECEGTYEQLPIRLGWAITIHKSQGMTLDEAVIDLGRGGFATGQVYVALSRLKSLCGLYLRTPIREADIQVEQSTAAFFQWAREGARFRSDAGRRGPSPKPTVTPPKIHRTSARSCFIGSTVDDVSDPKYHRPDCHWIDKMNVGRIAEFSTRAEAEFHGYRPCKVCRP